MSTTSCRVTTLQVANSSRLLLVPTRTPMPICAALLNRSARGQVGGDLESGRSIWRAPLDEAPILKHTTLLGLTQWYFKHSADRKQQ